MSNPVDTAFPKTGEGPRGAVTSLLKSRYPFVVSSISELQGIDLTGHQYVRVQSLDLLYKLSPLSTEADNGGSLLVDAASNRFALVATSGGESVDAAGTLAERDAYDDEAQGFTFDDIATGEVDNVIHRYKKASATSADWKGPFYFGRGEPGSDGIQSSNGTLADAIRVTQAEYNALSTPDPNTIFAVIG